MMRTTGTGRSRGGTGLAIFFALTIAVSAATGGPSPADKPLRPSGLAPEHAEANLVLVDVLVRDRQGKTVSGLGKEDFDLFIDRLPAPIATFESDCAAVPAKEPSAEATPAAAAPPALPRHIILFFDISHLTRPGRDRSLDAAIKYLREGMTDADKVMLLALKGKPILIQTFTSDRALLVSKLEGVKADNDMFDMSVAEERLNVLDVLRRDCNAQQGQTSVCQSRLNVALPYAQAEESRARRSLEAMRSLMPALAPIRGRKSLVYFSETLRDEPGLEYLLLASTTSQAQGIDLKLSLQDLHKEANAAGVSIYPVFAAGLGEGNGTNTSDASLGNIDSNGVHLLAQAGAAGEDGALGLDTTLALETGGQALKRSNDLGKIFTTVSSDMSCYYVIGYANPGPGDGKRHSIIVKTKAKEYEIRHRPYYEDLSETERLDRKFRSAMMAPAYFTEIAAGVEAYELAPRDKGIPFLIKVSFPLNEVTLVGQSDGRRAGEVEVRGAVWAGPSQICKFGRRFPLMLDPGESVEGRKVIYEAGCDLPPGNHDVTVAVLDGPSWEIGGAEVPLPVRAKAPGIAGDVVLWTSSSEDLLVAADATAVGIQETGSGHGFVPKGERRFGARETALLYVAVCPAPEGAPPPSAPGAPAAPMEIVRSILAGDTVVASFPPAPLSAPGGKPACEGVFAKIPAGQLPPGRYTYQVKLTGLSAEPVIRRAGFAIEADVPEKGKEPAAAQPPPPGS